MDLHIIKSGIIDCKRMHLNLTIRVPCPYCGTECQRDFTNRYLTYPSIGKEEPAYFECASCDEEFSAPVILHVSLSVGSPTTA